MSSTYPFSVGEIVDLDVESAHHFGLFCRCGGVLVLLRIVDLSYLVSVNSATQFAAPGDRLTARIVWVGDGTEKPVASIPSAYPENDPSTSGWLREGQVYSATVVRAVKDAVRCDGRSGYLVMLRPGAYALLCGEGITLRVGEICRVRAADVGDDMRYVRLAIA